MYLAYFYIDSDGDFYFEDYENLNDTYKLFENAQDAVEVMRLHLGKAIETFSTRDKGRYVIDAMIAEYESAESWEVDEKSDECVYIDRDLGRYEFTYILRKIDMFDMSKIKGGNS